MTTSCTAARIRRCSRRRPATSSPRRCFRSPPKADKHIVISLQPGAAGHAVHAAAARAAEDRARRRVARCRRRATASAPSRSSRERNWQPDRDFVSNATGDGDRGDARAISSRRRSPIGDVARRRSEAPTRRHAARRYQCVARARLRGLCRVDPEARREPRRRRTASRCRSRSSHSTKMRRTPGPPGKNRVATVC